MYTYALRVIIFILLIIISVQLDKDIKITPFYLASIWTIFLLAISFHMLYKNLNTYLKLGIFILLISLLIIHTVLTHTYLKKIKNKTHSNITIVSITLIWLYLAFIFKKIFTLDIYEERDNRSSIYNSSIKTGSIDLQYLQNRLMSDRVQLLSMDDLYEIKDKILSGDKYQSNLAKDVFELNTKNIFYSPNVSPKYIQDIITEMAPLSDIDRNIHKQLINLEKHRL